MKSASSCGWLQAMKLTVWILLLSSCFTSTNQEDITPGCFLEREAALLERPGCHPKVIMITYCTGYCKSVAVPSSDENTTTNLDQKITSHAKCCAIKSSINKTINFNCDNRVEESTIMEPTSCDCFQCEHY